jgi:hypothetical protein
VVYYAVCDGGIAFATTADRCSLRVRRQAAEKEVVENGQFELNSKVGETRALRNESFIPL